MENTTIKLAVVDDDELFTRLLAQFLSEIEYVEVVITALDGAEFIKSLKSIDEQPDIALIDIRMKHMDGIETLSILKEDYPDIKTIVISSHYRSSFMGYMMKIGINAFIPKGIPPEYLVDVIYSVHHKNYFFTDEQINILREQVSNNAPNPNAKSEALTEREINVLELICHQYTADQIAEILHVAKRTVEGHRSNLLIKTGVKNTVGLVIFAIQNKIVDINDFDIDNVVGYGGITN